MELHEAHERARDVFDRAVTEVTDWSAPTPCTDWTTRDLVNHLVSEQLWVPHLVTGETTAQVGPRYDGDLLGDDPAAAWRSASDTSRRAWADVPDDHPVHLSYATVPARDYRWQMTLDLAIHGWDLASATNHNPLIGEALSQALIDEFTDHITQWADSGIFAPPHPVTPTADPQNRLIALTGRNPNWHPPR
ncbi:TIGR03086 family metal-binding protein [Actinokineospora inagensis]|uniref:TIGR03086 family metal-binding protein n=1 Tax=Actinokineospora inagensis TaxID=103730 RepID=UPI00047B8596|nr:TIGR03086 family metal-binding protein [Actinokineospora inagensis]